ncbi:MAG: hypothetical protein M3Y87_33270 [Myxococcota bacterium]|nr:hypothetical protein [Myxococcota bacterium]
MPDDLLAMLADPETHAPLSRATEPELEALRAAISEGRARRRDGSPIEPFDAAFLTQERRVAYLVEQGVPNFVVDERVELEDPL